MKLQAMYEITTLIDIRLCNLSEETLKMGKDCTEAYACISIGKTQALTELKSFIRTLIDKELSKE